MRKFGGEEALTKNDSSDNTLKCNLLIDNVPTVDLDVNRLVEENVTKMCSQKQLLLEQEPELKVVHVAKKTRVRKKDSRWGKLERIMDKLDNLEEKDEPEKSLRIQLNLYQMENY